MRAERLGDDAKGGFRSDADLCGIGSHIDDLDAILSGKLQPDGRACGPIAQVKIDQRDIAIISSDEGAFAISRNGADRKTCVFNDLLYLESDENFVFDD